MSRVEGERSTDPLREPLAEAKRAQEGLQAEQKALRRGGFGQARRGARSELCSAVSGTCESVCHVPEVSSAPEAESHCCGQHQGIQS
eukprot:scaffold7498_cov258-Pinguiococcus_pyrenoidosus.AAC.3